MNCPYCGEPVKDGARFCGTCGADLSRESLSTTETLRDSLEERVGGASASQPTERFYQPVAQTQRMPQAQPAQQRASQQAGPHVPQPSPHVPQANPHAAQASPHTPQPNPHQNDPRGHQEQSYQRSPQAGQQQTPQGYPPQGQQPYQQMPQGYNGPVGSVQQVPAKRSGLPTWAKAALIAVGAVMLVGVAIVVMNIVRSPEPESPIPPVEDPIVSAEPTGEAAYELTETYTDDTYGYSFRGPADPSSDNSREAGQRSLYWSDPDLWINTYVGSARADTTPSDVADFLEEQYDADIIETASDYVISVSVDEDGDTNYTLVYVTGSNLQYMDIYYHPADEDVMKPVALALMESFMPGEGEDPEEDLGDDVPVEIGGDLFSDVAEGSRVEDATYGFSVTATAPGFSSMDVDDGAIFLMHEDPELYISCYGEDDTYDSLEAAYRQFSWLASDDVEPSDPSYDEASGSFTYTETGIDGVSLYKVYVREDSTLVFVAMYDRDDEDAARLAESVADTFQLGA